MTWIGAALFWTQIALIASVIALSIALATLTFKWRLLIFNELWPTRIALVSFSCLWVISSSLRLFADWITGQSSMLANESLLCAAYSVLTSQSQISFYAVLLVLMDSMTSKSTTRRLNRTIFKHSLQMTIPILVVSLGFTIFALSKHKQAYGNWTAFWNENDRQCIVPYGLGLWQATIVIVWLISFQFIANQAAEIVRNHMVRKRIRLLSFVVFITAPISTCFWTVSTLYVASSPFTYQSFMDASAISSALTVHVTLWVFVWRPLKEAYEVRNMAITIDENRRCSIQYTDVGVAARLSVDVSSSRTPRLQNIVPRQSIVKTSTEDLNQLELRVRYEPASV
eukprot:TRINITY_DN10284_c0_g1_i1.p1 TRINITY_DN10284_c0_g1~~TRINITY_DN10284_c0_g1_i1.p1  ORF type:complete len:340 (+),score=51.82 TRINITY_DN10284_c0_g1_i1:68-1087(+)